MQFSARLKRAFLGGDAKLVKELRKMLRDEKNAEFKDQIYYALAQIDKTNGNEAGVFENLHQFCFFLYKQCPSKSTVISRNGGYTLSTEELYTCTKILRQLRKINAG